MNLNLFELPPCPASSGVLVVHDLLGEVPQRPAAKSGRGPASGIERVVDYSNVVREFAHEDMFQSEKEHAQVDASTTDVDPESEPLSPEVLAYLLEEARWVRNHPHFVYYGAALHAYVLDESLEQLTSEDIKPDALKHKGETLQWIFAGRYIAGKKATDIPFSFELCCRYYGEGVDPDDFRRRCLQSPTIRSLIVQLHMAREEELPPLKRVYSYSDYLPAASPEVRKLYQFIGN